MPPTVDEVIKRPRRFLAEPTSKPMDLEQTKPIFASGRLLAVVVIERSLAMTNRCDSSLGRYREHHHQFGFRLVRLS